MAKGFKSGGRVKGSPNKITVAATERRTIYDLAQQHVPAAIATLVDLAVNAKSEQARVAASREILDRAYGRAPQAVTLAGGDGPPIRTQVLADEAVLAVVRDLGQRVRVTGAPLKTKPAEQPSLQASAPQAPAAADPASDVERF